MDNSMEIDCVRGVGITRQERTTGEHWDNPNGTKIKSMYLLTVYLIVVFLKNNYTMLILLDYDRHFILIIIFIPHT